MTTNSTIAQKAARRKGDLLQLAKDIDHDHITDLTGEVKYGKIEIPCGKRFIGLLQLLIL